MDNTSANPTIDRLVAKGLVSDEAGQVSLTQEGLDFAARATAKATSEVAFVSYDKGHTFVIEVSYPENDRPALLDDLAAIGFQAPQHLCEAPPLDGVATTNLGRSGSALFGGWKTDEREEFLAQAQAVLSAHGYPAIKRENRRKEL